MQPVARMVWRAYDRLAHPFRLRAAVRRLSLRAPPQKILVVCHGNICRSPYAAAVLRRLLGSRVRVTSAGFIGPGRACPAMAVEVAAARGLDLSGHRSRLLVPSDVFAADLIVVMDTDQEWGVRALFGRPSDDVVLLGDFDPELAKTREIRDPIEQPKKVFEQSYSRIERCVGELARAVALSEERVFLRGGLAAQGDQDGGRDGPPEQRA